MRQVAHSNGKVRVLNALLLLLDLPYDLDRVIGLTQWLAECFVTWYSELAPRF